MQKLKSVFKGVNWYRVFYVVDFCIAVYCFCFVLFNLPQYSYLDIGIVCGIFACGFVFAFFLFAFYIAFDVMSSRRWESYVCDKTQAICDFLEGELRHGKQ